MKTVTLHNGIQMPIIGLGTYRLENSEGTLDLIVKALEIGYRHIDTASAYGNEEAIGKGIKKVLFQEKKSFLYQKLPTQTRDMTVQ